MKKGINFTMTIDFGIDLGLVKKINLKFMQKDTFIKMTYPSTNVVRVPDTNKINVNWTYNDTFKFKSGYVELDTKIFLNEVSQNPQTPIVKFYLKPTLFTKEEMS